MDCGIKCEHINPVYSIESLEFRNACKRNLCCGKVVDQNFDAIKNTDLCVWEVDLDPAVCI